MPSQHEGDARSRSAGAADEAVRESNACFPRAVRLLKADEFAALFKMRPVRRSPHFVVYLRAREPQAPGRFGVVLGKKFAPRAATRNMARRTLREAFRLRRPEFVGWDVLVRLHQRFDRQQFPGAAPPALKRLCRAEVQALFDAVLQQAARQQRRASSGAPSQRGVAPTATPASTEASQQG